MTQIVERQIGDGAVSNQKIKAGAGIETSKLADGADFLKRSGSVSLTGALDANNNSINNLPAPSSGSQPATKTYVDAAISNLPAIFKFRNARAATTANVSISNPVSAIYDGVTLAAGDLLLVRANTAQTENGIYVFNGIGAALTRSLDSNAWNEFPGSSVSINEGTTYADARFYCPVNDGGTLGSTAITYSQDASNPLNAANFIDKEIPSGAISGSNTAFTLSFSPISGSEHIYLNGILQEAGAGNDYSISGASVTFNAAPLTGEKIRATYRK